MKNIILALVAFAVGVYVGRPAQIVVDAARIRDCTVIQAVVPEKASSADGAKTPTMVPGETRTESTAVAPVPAPSPSESVGDQTEQDVNAANSNDDRQPIVDCRVWAKKEALYVDGHTFDIHTIKFTNAEARCFTELFEEIVTRALVVDEAGFTDDQRYPNYIIFTRPSDVGAQ